MPTAEEVANTVGTLGYRAANPPAHQPSIADTRAADIAAATPATLNGVAVQAAPLGQTKIAYVTAPVAGGFVGYVLTAGGWKGFGTIEA
jgi:hypothetical protein